MLSLNDTLPAKWEAGSKSEDEYLYDLCCIFVNFGLAVAKCFQMSTDGTVSHGVAEKGVKQRKKPRPTFMSM
jgi:hypothetical protein